jgi:hypothetical protein
MSSTARMPQIPAAVPDVPPVAAVEPSPKGSEAPTRLADDPHTDAAAWASWVRHLLIATAIAFPVLTAGLGTAFVWAGQEPEGAYAIAAFASLWMCVFVGGAAGTTAYELRHPD